MILECGCPGEYPDWHGRNMDLSHHAAHVLPIATFLHMPLSYETYRQRQQQEIDQLELREMWPGFALTHTGILRGQLIRLLENTDSPSRHFKHLESNFNVHCYLHHGGIGTIRSSIREQQITLLDNGDMPKEIYLTADERYYDSSTQYGIALKKMKYMGKNRDIIVCYEEVEDKVDIITIHPLKTYQKLQRIKSGRWKKI